MMTEGQGLLKWMPNSPINSFRIRRDAPETAPSTEQLLRSPERRTASVSRGDDEWSDENMRRWQEADQLDPELAAWLEAQLGE